jgi:hypothetical protein
MNVATRHDSNDAQLAPYRGGHLSDDELIARRLERDAWLPSPGGDHLDTCGTCRARVEGLQRWLDEAADDARREADEVFTTARLDEQKARILARLDQGAQARVLPFPPVPDQAISRRVAVRWISAAAAAGLLIGFSAPRLTRFLPQREARIELVSSAADGRTRPAGVDAGFGPAAGTNEEAFLIELDAALEGPAIQELSAIDALTPRVREISIESR